MWPVQILVMSNANIKIACDQGCSVRAAKPPAAWDLQAQPPAGVLNGPQSGSCHPDSRVSHKKLCVCFESCRFRMLTCGQLSSDTAPQLEKHVFLQQVSVSHLLKLRALVTVRTSVQIKHSSTSTPVAFSKQGANTTLTYETDCQSQLQPWRWSSKNITQVHFIRVENDACQVSKGEHS